MRVSALNVSRITLSVLSANVSHALFPTDFPTDSSFRPPWLHRARISKRVTDFGDASVNNGTTHDFSPPMGWMYLVNRLSFLSFTNIQSFMSALNATDVRSRCCQASSSYY